MNSPLQLLNVRETAQLLGIAPQTVYTWIRIGKLPYLRLGKNTIAFEYHDLMQFLDSIKVTVKT